MNRQDYANTFRNQLKHIGEFPAGYARLGKGDGSGVIIASLSDRTVYIYDATAQVPSAVPVVENVSIVALNNPALEGTRVRLGYPPWYPNRMHVMGLDTGEGLRAVGGVTPTEQASVAAFYPSATNLTALRLTPDTGLSVWVAPAWYFHGATGDPQYFAGDTLALDSVVSALTSGQHTLSLVCLDTLTGLLAHVDATASTGSLKDILGVWTIDGLTIPQGYQASGAIHLIYGQTSITEDDVYRGEGDPRVLYQLPALVRATVSVSTNTTLTLGQETVLVDASAGDVTITLPPVTGIQHTYHIKKIDASGYMVTVDADSTKTIDGATTQTFDIPNMCMSITSYPTTGDWYII